MEDIRLYGLLFITIISFASVCWFMWNFQTQVDELNYNIESMDRKGIDKLEEIEYIGQKFAANHNYSKDYDCKNYSDDLYEVLKALGYNVKEVSGCKAENGSECHRWLRIGLELDFEPIDGEFVNYEDVYRVYKVKE